MDLVEQGVAILNLTEKDPLGRWGCRLVKEKLAADGIHVTWCVRSILNIPLGAN